MVLFKSIYGYTVRVLTRKFSVTSVKHNSPLRPELTAVRYPHVKRGSYATLTDADIRHFESILSSTSGVLTDPDEVKGYNIDWNLSVQGQGTVVLRPKSTDEVSEIMKYCNTRRLAVCPQGGNTSMVQGSVPVFDEVILSTSLMNDIISLDHVSGILTCQAGCVLEKLDDHVAEHGLIMPLDLGAKGSCQIGGNISTNAAGIRLIRYGSLRGNVLGVEAVLANGEVMDCLSTMRKDNTGYDMKQLFIGSEGTLGIVTAVSILCPQRPSTNNVAFLGCENFDQVFAILKAAKKSLGEVISAVEFIDAVAMDRTVNALKIANPIGDWPFYVLIEISGSNEAHDEEKLAGFLEHSMESGLVLDGTVTSDSSKIEHIWSIRHLAGDAIQLEGYVYRYDISLPIEHYYKIVEVVRERVKDFTETTSGYGHVGDGNLHLNVAYKEYSPELRALLEPFIYDYVAKCKGSVSAEHGLGFQKHEYIYHSKSKAAVDVMVKLKQMLDPKNILNPYKTLPQDYS